MHLQLIYFAIKNSKPIKAHKCQKLSTSLEWKLTTQLERIRIKFACTLYFFTLERPSKCTFAFLFRVSWTVIRCLMISDFQHLNHNSFSNTRNKRLQYYFLGIDKFWICIWFKISWSQLFTNIVIILSTKPYSLSMALFPVAFI